MTSHGRLTSVVNAKNLMGAYLMGSDYISVEERRRKYSFTVFTVGPWALFVDSMSKLK